MTSPILQVKDLSVYYNKKKALNSVSIDFYPNEITALIGPSGSGKSTLLRSVNRMGDLNPEVTLTGAIDYNGKNIYSPRTDTVDLRKEIGMVFQTHHLLPQCTTLENVLIPTLTRGMRKDMRMQMRERAVTLLQNVGLGGRLHQLPEQLSGGERQRAAVVRALINRPTLLLADEPTGSLNEDGAQQLTDLLLELNRSEGMAMIMVTHAGYIADRIGHVVTLHNGQLVSRE